ncbi:hypothetical protein SOVF_158970, partial [Spinacia oleracea]
MELSLQQHETKSGKFNEQQTSSRSTTTTEDQEAAAVLYSDEYYVRSYTCNFCKKGFSNAQALGGHMNIHRRDRAKLRDELSTDDYSPTHSDLSTSKTRSSRLYVSKESRTKDDIWVGNGNKHEALALFVDSSSSSRKAGSSSSRVVT